jgi:hypothetical protein
MHTLRKFYLKYILSTTNIQIPGWSVSQKHWQMINVISLEKIQTDYINRVITIALSHTYSLYFKDNFLGLGQLNPINQIISFQIMRL